jgi:hypothetical protein
MDSQSQSDILHLFNSSVQTGPRIQSTTLLFRYSEEYLTTSRPKWEDPYDINWVIFLIWVITHLLNYKVFLIFLVPLPEEQIGVIKIDASFPSDCISVQLVTCKAVSCGPFGCRVWPFCLISSDILSTMASGMALLYISGIPASNMCLEMGYLDWSFPVVLRSVQTRQENVLN